MGLLNYLSADKAHEQPIEIQIGKNKYKMGRVRIDDLAALQARLRQERIRSIIALQTEIQPSSVYAKTLAAVASIDPSEDELFDCINGAAGRAFLLWRCIQRHQPEVTEAKIKEEWETGAREIANLLLQESHLTDEDAVGADPTAEPAQPSTGSNQPACFVQVTGSPSPRSGA